MTVVAPAHITGNGHVLGLLVATVGWPLGPQMEAEGPPTLMTLLCREMP
jgi:hypothetical protein